MLQAVEKKKTELTLENNELQDKEFSTSNRLKQTEVRFTAVQKELDETLAENQNLRNKLNAQNRSFISTNDDNTNDMALNQSMELVKANYERDEHKWRAEKMRLEAKM